MIAEKILDELMLSICRQIDMRDAQNPCYAELWKAYYAALETKCILTSTDPIKLRIDPDGSMSIV